MILKVKRLLPEAKLPTRATAGSAGYDLYAMFDFRIPAYSRTEMGTGLSIEIPPGHEGQIRGRSGMAFKHGVRIFQTGTIDSDYRGHVVILLENFTSKDVHGCAGDRIAQLVISPVAAPDVVEVDELEATDRGEGGFGSSGR